jgi:hypothetical protein
MAVKVYVESLRGINVAIPERLTIGMEPIDWMMRDQEIQVMSAAPSCRTFISHFVQLTRVDMELALIFVAIDLKPSRI